MNDDRIEITIELSSDGRMLLVHRNGKGVVIDTYQQEYVVAEVDRLINEHRLKMASYIVPQVTNTHSVL